jgi:hypothetical protein
LDTFDIVHGFLRETTAGVPEPACSISTELSTDLYITASERELVMKESVEGFQGSSGEVVRPRNQWPQNPVPNNYIKIVLKIGSKQNPVIPAFQGLRYVSQSKGSVLLSLQDYM